MKKISMKNLAVTLSIIGFAGWVSYSQGVQVKAWEKLSDSSFLRSHVQADITGISIVEAGKTFTVDQSPFVSTKIDIDENMNDITTAPAPPIENHAALSVPVPPALPPLPGKNQVVNIKVKAIVSSNDSNNVAIIENGKDEITVKEGSHTNFGKVEKINKNSIQINGEIFMIDNMNKG